MITLFSRNIKAQEEKNVYKSELENEVWITNKILGLDLSIQQYSLNKFTKRRFLGNLTSFTDKINYKSSYVLLKKIA